MTARASTEPARRTRDALESQVPPTDRASIMALRTPSSWSFGALFEARVQGRTALAAAAVTVMTVGGAVLVGEHVWLTD